MPLVGGGDESGIEKFVKISGEEKAVEDIQALGVGFAIRSGFRVARPHEFDSQEFSRTRQSELDSLHQSKRIGTG